MDDKRETRIYEIMLTHIVLIAVMIAAYLYWRHAQEIKEAAMAATRRHCRLCEVQMLDDYIALHSCSLARGKTGKIRFRRRFTFEFSATGKDRYQGFCLMEGADVVAIEMPAYRLPTEFTPP